MFTRKYIYIFLSAYKGHISLFRASLENNFKSIEMKKSTCKSFAKTIYINALLVKIWMNCGEANLYLFVHYVIYWTSEAQHFSKKSHIESKIFLERVTLALPW